MNALLRFGYLLCLLLIMAGCNSGPNIAPVSGKITIDGKALTTGVIMVYHKGFRPATAMIQNDGSFIFKTLSKDDGCIVGEHPITVSSNRHVNETTVEYFIPEHYGDVNKSNLKIKIDGPNNDLKIELTWKGSGHAEPYRSTN